jgi:hypothetical protein
MRWDLCTGENANTLDASNGLIVADALKRVKQWFAE